MSRMALALLQLALVVGLLRMELVYGTREGAFPATQAGAAHEATLCEEMQRLTDNKLTDAEFVGTWLARASAEPRVHSPLNRPAVAQRVHWHPDGVPRTNTPRDVVEARLKLQQIHGIDEKRQYFEADGSLTLRWKDERFCFNATGWDNETTSLSAPGHPPAAHPHVASEGGCHCDSGEREAGLCACLRFGGDALVNASSWMWLPDVFILNSAGGGAGQRSKTQLEQTLMISQAGSITWSTRFTESLATDFSLDLMPFDSQNLTLNVGGFESGRSLQLIWADDQEGHVGGNASNKNSSTQRSYVRDEYDSRANAALAPKGWDTCSATTPHGSGPTACGGAAPPQPCDTSPCLQFLVGLSRNSYSYMFSYIYPSMLLLGISYLALFVDKGSPGRPGIHSVTVLTELTLANAQRTQLPPVNNNMWIMSFMNTMLCFHIAIFLEFGVVHYAECQRLNQLLVAQGTATTPGGSALTKQGSRALLRPFSPSALVQALEVERAASPPGAAGGGDADESCCSSLRQWHRHAGKIDWLFRMSIPPCVGIVWLRMMFAVGYNYSEEYLVGSVALFTLVYAWVGWAQLQFICGKCCGKCGPCLAMCCDCVCSLARCCKRRE